ncbi:MAG: hypothetical protein KAS32_25605, partial [Candidatus Peribacteraceae bacterium]|nr:hypothetical protein [Candidatus Peribacteraceae bacterium]
FNMAKYETQLKEAETFDIAYEVQLNTYKGRTTPQFMLVDIQFNEDHDI